jgi:hypothetical protein
VNGSQVHEELLVWMHLSLAGFLKGEYRMVDGESLPNEANSPKNAYSTYLQIVFDGQYGPSGAGVPRHNLKSGPQIPVEVVAELDRKTDDGKPYKGAVQFSAYAPNGAVAPEEGGPGACTTALDVDADWNLRGSSTNCGVATLL